MTEPQRFSIRLPRPLWIGLSTVALVLVGVGLRFGVPIYRHHAAIQVVERLEGRVSSRPGVPEWLREWLNDEWMKPLDAVTQVDLIGTQGTDADVSRLA